MMDEDCKINSIGFFDFDGTLVKSDSFIRFGLYAKGRWRFFSALIRAIPWLIEWKTGIVSSSRAKEKMFGYLFKGMSIQEFAKKGDGFATVIGNMLRPEIFKDLVSFHDARGRVVIVTASIDDWVRPWAVRQGVETVIGTKVEVGRDGRLTGKFSTLNCRGAEKVRRVTEYLTEISETDENADEVLEKYEIHAWGNLPDDKEMLEIADFPHPV